MTITSDDLVAARRQKSLTTKIAYDIPVRPETDDAQPVFARLVLPHDLTATEAERLCAAVRAIAFPECMRCGRISHDDGLGVVDGYCSACDGLR